MRRESIAHGTRTAAARFAYLVFGQLSSAWAIIECFVVDYTRS